MLMKEKPHKKGLAHVVSKEVKDASEVQEYCESNSIKDDEVEKGTIINDLRREIKRLQGACQKLNTEGNELREARVADATVIKNLDKKIEIYRKSVMENERLIKELRSVISHKECIISSLEASNEFIRKYSDETVSRLLKSYQDQMILNMNPMVVVAESAEKADMIIDNIKRLNKNTK